MLLAAMAPAWHPLTPGVTPPNGLELVHGFSYEFRKD